MHRVGPEPEIKNGLSEDQYHQLGHVAAYRGAPDNGAAALKDRRRCEVTVPDFTLIPQFVVGTRRIALLQTRSRRLPRKSCRCAYCPASSACLRWKWSYSGTSTASKIRCLAGSERYFDEWSNNIQRNPRHRRCPVGRAGLQARRSPVPRARLRRSSCFVPPAG